MTTVHPEWYWDVARQLGDLSTKLEQKLRELDGNLDVSRSAGVHSTAGTGWAAAYSQSAADIFELTSLSAIAAGNFAKMVHTAGANHAEAENKNAPEKSQIPIPPPPQVTSLQYSLHPTRLCNGGLGDIPDRWHLIDGRHKKAWADCDTGKIEHASQMFGKFSGDFKDVKLNLPGNPDEPEDVPMIRSAVDRFLNAVDDVSAFSGYLGSACHEVADKSHIEREQIKQVLFYCEMTINTWKITRAAPVLRWFVKKMIDAYIEELKDRAGRDVDALLTELDGFVDGAVQQTGGSMAGATGDVQLWLAPFLGRYARQGYPVTGRNLFDNIRAGRDGELRAGLDPNAPKRAVFVNGRTRIPDRIDDVNRQVTEVKNTNDTQGSAQQIHDESDWAAQNGYTMTLVVDNRTQLAPDTQQLVNEGRVTVIREELDDNLPKGQSPAPFIPKPGWGPPASNKDPRGSTGVPVP
ncbi:MULTISPECIES: putative toxin [unclassified Nocardia]|uniref:putative toxin n=1 Tax=unclassified Nocardia TaxID=2637762 RepID=UPI001CE3FF7F|nr:MULTISPECIES: putative toxin [unclassified Nocardia]